MIAVLKQDTTEDQLHELTEWFENQGVKCHISRGDYQTIIGLVGDTSSIDIELVESLDIIENVKRISEPVHKSEKKKAKIGDFDRSGVKTVGVVGLGLIGGSFAKAFKEHSNAKVLGMDIDETICQFAKLDGTLDDFLTDDNIGECDLIIPALYNQAIIDFVTTKAPLIKKGALVIDTGGLKRRVCTECYKIANEYGFTFIGGHPMAGKKFSGYKHSTGKLFRDASMIVVPEDTSDISFFEHIEDVFSPCRFGSITICSAEKHDQMIAFTSEMAHIVSNAYIKSPTAKEHKGYSAGSYKDMTRVAWLNEDMWTEIFLENRDNLIFELETIIKYLKEYEEALKNGDAETLHKILRDGKLAKEEVDGI